MTIKLSKVRNNLFEEMNRQWDCTVSKHTCFQRIFMGKKKRAKKLFDGKRIWKTRGQQYSSSYYYFLCVLLVFLLVFPFFRELSIISSVGHFFVEAYPFKNICQTEIFVIVYLPKEYLLNKQSTSLCKLSKTFRVLNDHAF